MFGTKVVCNRCGKVVCFRGLKTKEEMEEDILLKNWLVKDTEHYCPFCAAKIIGREANETDTI